MIISFFLRKIGKNRNVANSTAPVQLQEETMGWRKKFLNIVSKLKCIKWMRSKPF